MTDEDINHAVAQLGEMQPEVVSGISAEQHERARATAPVITADQYLEALKVLDSAAEGSPEYVHAAKIILKYESAGQ